MIPVAPLRLELTFTTNSGAEVPKATIVSPITISEIQNFLASEEEPSTSKSAPLIRNTNPRIKSRSVIRSMRCLKRNIKKLIYFSADLFTLFIIANPSPLSGSF